MVFPLCGKYGSYKELMAAPVKVILDMYHTEVFRNQQEEQFRIMNNG